MKRRPASRGIPGGLILAGGLSRHGRSCYCRICEDNRREDLELADAERAARETDRSVS